MIGGHSDQSDELRALSGATATYRLACSNEDSLQAARAISTVIGPHAAVIGLYLEAFSYAPAHHLKLLQRRGARIVFAPSIDVVLTSQWAASRRGRVLNMTAARDMRIEYGPESRAAGLYDPVIDALVFPTAYRAKDLKSTVLHELGHALTIRRADPRQALLVGLPSRMHRHVFARNYEGPTPEITLRQRVLEALAEGYIYLVDGRMDELPQVLSSELTFMLQTVDDGDQVRLEFELTSKGERTASRVSAREIIDGNDPDEGHLFAPMRLESDTAAWDLDEDEISVWRQKRRPAA